MSKQLLATVCVLQNNPAFGDLKRNATRLVHAAKTAYQQGARLLVTGHMALCGVAMHGLSRKAAFTLACDSARQDMARQLADYPDLTLITSDADGVFSLRDGTCTTLACAFGQQPCLLQVQDVLVGIVLAYGSSHETTLQHCSVAATSGAQLLCVLDAAPYRMGQQPRREQQYATMVQNLQLPLIYSNITGGQETFVYEGCSFGLQANATLAGRASRFISENWMVQLHHTNSSGITLQASTTLINMPDSLLGLPPVQQHYSCSTLWQALVLGLRDYVEKSGFKQLVLGMSGGIDSALVLALAVDALGHNHVHAVMMPSAYTADISLLDAKDMAERLDVAYHEIPISDLFDTFNTALQPLFANTHADVTEENLQARIRGTLLMALSNKWGALLLATGNKSELATGYCTLYGDMAGGFAPIKDVLKTQVFELARWRNKNDFFGTGSNPIPKRIISRPPSAELRPNQTDQDSLPPYDILDAIVMQYVEYGLSIKSMIAQGLPKDAVLQVTRLINANEYKRRQAPLGTCISQHAFGCGWNTPVVNRFQET